ncbi:zinc finger, C2H2 type [Dictyocaulus viviparus]|uniref:Zinc finger, C2H2 type n=1 Tax=Dictyocaulus viviparus TaxID=29172 RepID=A0A0D8Y0V8_DICVI|nr:zinc finger, C2H2 type [Dictyocaulus viviparus]
MYSPDLYSPGDIVSILSSHEMEPNGIIVAGEKVIYNSSVKKNPVFNLVTRDYMVIKTDNETRNDGALSDRVDIKVAVMRKIKADDLSSSLWFPKKVVIMTDNRRFETTAWTHCSNSRDDSLCSDEPHSSAEHNTITSSNMDSDPSLSSINASSWYSPQNPTLPSTSSPSTTECFRLSPLTNEVSINTLSLANRSSPLNIANNDEEGDKHTNNEERFGIEVRRFNIPVNVYSRNSRHLSSSCSATTVSNGYPCFVEGCTSILRNRTALRKHAKVHAERTHSCEQCGRRFAEKTKLNRHMLTHTGEKAFKCERSGCSKTFSLESNLKSHMKTHTGEKPYSCQFCDHAFSHPYNLRVHISRRHKDKNTS